MGSLRRVSRCHIRRRLVGRAWRVASFVDGNRAPPHAPDASAHVAGDGPSRNHVLARCPNAVFMGTVPRDVTPEVLASADLFVQPSEASCTNLIVLEALASGLPVVVMVGGSARERVAESTAVVCRSQADFIVETAALVRTEERRKAMALEARKYASAQEWAAGLTSVYAEYRAAAEISRVRRDLQPAFIPQSRRF
jgi:glycosyltransferase involved in cell wall biosynthesis